MSISLFSKFRFLLCILLAGSPSCNLLAQEKNLDFYLAQARTSSPLLADINNQILSNRIDSLKMLANYGFIVSGEGYALYAPSYNGYGYDQAITNGQTIIAGLRISKEFIGNNNLNTRLRSFNLIQSQLKSKQEINRISLQKQIADQYVAAYTSQQMLSVDREIAYLLNQENIVLKKLTQASVFKQTDYLAFKVLQQQNNLILQQREAELTGNFALLNYLTGLDDTTIIPLAKPAYSTLPQHVFASSPYAASFQADSLKFLNDAEIINYDYRRKIIGFTDAGFQSSLMQQPYKNYGVSVGVNISLPLYDGHKKELLLQQNDLAKNTSSIYYERQKKQFELQVTQLNTQMQQYKKIMETAALQLTYAKTLIEANAKQLPTGDVRMSDYILSINNLLNLRSSMIQTENILFILQNQLQFLTLQ